MRKKITLSLLALVLLMATVVTASAGSSTVEFEISQLTIVEDDNSPVARFLVQRTGDLGDAATVVLSSVDGTATSADHDEYPTMLNFAPGVSVVEVLVAALDDSGFYEGTEWFSLRLSNPSPNTRIGARRTMTVFINDHDDYPRIIIGVVSPLGVEPGPGRQVVASVPISLSNPSVEQVSATFNTTDVTATAGSDYIPATATITFEPLDNRERQDVTITILGDGLNESRETFNMHLLNVVNADVGPSRPFTIINNIPYPQQVDFDGNGRADMAGYDPSAAMWWFPGQYAIATIGFQFGTSVDVIVPGDYTGDGRTDAAFWRPSTGEWFVLRSEDSSYYSVHFGSTGDIPVPADFDADGVADLAVFRPSTGTWYIHRSSDASVDIVRFGMEGDRPTPTDFDGDWKADIAVYRPNAGDSSQWWIKRSSDELVTVMTFGEPGDRTIAADYTGDGKADVAVWRPTTAQWRILRSEDGTYYVVPGPSFAGAIPAPGDYTGDGRADYGLMNNIFHTWNVYHSTDPRILSSGSIHPSATIPLAIVNVH